MNNWGVGALKWNLVLNQEMGPQNHGCNDCLGLAVINTENGQITFNEDFYAVGYFSSHVRPGAVCVNTTISGNNNAEVMASAFRNPDNTYALIVLNPSLQPVTFLVKWGIIVLPTTLQAESVGAYVW